MVRRYLKYAALLLIAASASFAQQAALDDGKQAVPKDCGSVVIVKCDDLPAKTQQSNSLELRRQSPQVQQLEGVVIEGEAIRRRSIEAIMAGAFPPLLPRDGNYTFATGEGSKCTCMNVCPPFPFACCACSPRAGR